MDKESSHGIGMRLLAPRLNNRNLIFSAPPNQHWPRPRPLLENQPWEEHCSVTLLRSSPILQTPATNYYTYTHIHTKTITDTYTYTHSFTSPPPIPRLRRFEPPAWQAGLWLAPGNGCMSGWMLARAGLLPLLQSRVSMVYYVLLLLRCFSCSHTVLPKEHSLGVIFFPRYIPHVMLYFSSIPCLPVLSTPLSYMYVVYGQVDGLFRWLGLVGASWNGFPLPSSIRWSGIKHHWTLELFRDWARPNFNASAYQDKCYVSKFWERPFSIPAWLCTSPQSKVHKNMVGWVWCGRTWLACTEPWS